MTVIADNSLPSGGDQYRTQGERQDKAVERPCQDEQRHGTADEGKYHRRHDDERDNHHIVLSTKNLCIDLRKDSVVLAQPVADGNAAANRTTPNYCKPI